MGAYPKRNAFVYSFKSKEVLEGAAIWEGLTKVSHKATIEGRAELRGNKGRRYGVSRGDYKGTVELEFGAEGFYDWAKDHPGYLTEFFNPVIANEEGSRRDVVKIVGLTFEDTDAPSEGTDPDTVALSGMCEDILVSTNDGPFRSLFDGAEEGETSQ